MAEARGRTQRYVLPVILLGALAVRVVAVVGLEPATDVYYYLSQAAQVALSGGNPYEHAYVGIPADLVTQGAQQVFAYFPVTFLYLLPFYVAGDVRYGLIAADLVVGACIYLYGGRWNLEGTLVYLFVPFTVLFSTYYVNAALVGMVFLAAFLLLESRGEGKLGAASLGASMAAAQFSLLLAPLAFLYYARRGRWVEVGIAAAVAVVAIAPFVLSSHSFLNETIYFQFQRNTAPLVALGGPVGILVNPTLGAFFASALGVTIPWYAKAVVELVLLAVLIRVTDLSNMTRNSALFVLASALVLPNDFFWSYLELPFMLGIFWLSAPKELVFVRRE